MCGIYCSICRTKDGQYVNEALLKYLKNRGPDQCNTLADQNVLFAGFVLWQQGAEVTPQPICLHNWICLFNGDIYNKNVEDGRSDTSWLVEQLSTCKDDSDIVFLFKSLKGPYSVVFYNRGSGHLYFARDPLGRNSLLLQKNPRYLQVLSSSVIPKSIGDQICIELPPCGIYKLSASSPGQAVLYPWLKLEETVDQLNDLKKIFSDVITKECIYPDWSTLPETRDDLFDFNQICDIHQPPKDLFPSLVKNDAVNQTLLKFLQLLEKSVQERVTFTTKYCSLCVKDRVPECTHSKIGILFSGGIDCTLLAIIADKYVHPDDSIDLINVAFESPNAKDINWNVPDRVSAKESYKELEALCPKRIWRFLEVNVTRQDLNSILESHIKHLIYPLNTVLDESLGCAFWFASHGEGNCNDEPYVSTSRVILIGSGADELFGGYTRHRNAFTRCTGKLDEKLQNLSKELEMDWHRIPSRNLGRDDRVIADNSKTARAPFIQEDLVQFVRSLTPGQRCCFSLEQGIGDKLFLRLCGYKLGLRYSISLRKRAIQFGSRIANKHQNAKDLSTALQ